MREIKFRAWDKENAIMLPDKDDGRDPMFLLSTRLYDDDIVFMQYTGLKDINAVEIFAGDIVKVIDVGFGYEYIGVINFKNQELLELTLEIVKEYSSMPQGSRDIMRTLEYHCFEVIGNIYQNPELLKQP